MSRSFFAVSALLAMLTALACNNAEMTGTARKKAGVQQPATPTQPPPAAPVPPGTPAPSPKPPTPTSPNPNPNPNPQPPTVPGQPPVITEPPIELPENPTPPVPTPPGIGSEIDTGSGPSIIDIIGGLVKLLTDVQIDQPNENEVIFGGNKVFHIGDGEFAASSECAGEISTYNLKGTRYFFEFEVLTDATTINASIGKICGVDYNESNSVFLQDGNTNLEQLPLSKAQTSAVFQAKQMNKGKYTILVESRAAGAENAGQPNDHDDYIVGLVKISADKPIKPGRVGARP